MLQSEQAWAGQPHNGIEFNTPEEIEDFVSAMEQLKPDQSLQMEPLLRPRAVEDSPLPLMRFCPVCDQWHSVFTQDAMSKLPEGRNSGLMGM